MLGCFAQCFENCFGQKCFRNWFISYEFGLFSPRYKNFEDASLFLLEVRFPFQDITFSKTGNYFIEDMISPSTYAEGLLFSWPWSCLPSLLNFLFLDPLGETATIVFVRAPLDIKQYLTKECFLTFLIKTMETHQTFSFFFCPPGKRLLLTPGMRIGLEFRTILGPFEDHFRTPYAPKFCFSINNKFPWNGTY